MLPLLIAGCVVLLLVGVALAVCWGMFGMPRRPRLRLGDLARRMYRSLARRMYRGRRRHDPGNPEQLRPAEPEPETQQLEDDSVRVLPNMGPLDAAPPWYFGHVQQHRYPSIPMHCLRCNLPDQVCRCHEEVLSHG